MSRSTLGLSETVQDYVLTHGVREHPVAAALRAWTAEHPLARMQISAEQGQFMAWLVEALGVRRAVEVGTFTGYSALVVALAMPDDGRIIACDVNEETTAVGRRHWEQAGVASKIDLRLAPAVETLDALIAEGAGPFDLFFLDADKTGYARYVEQAHALLRPGGVVLIDNVLWSGKVAAPPAEDDGDDTIALRALNRALHADERWDLTLLPVGDGLTLLRKR